MEDPLHHLTALALKQRFLRRELSATAIVRHFLARIDRYNDTLGAFLHVFHERALAKAEYLDAKHARGEPVGKLAAIPIGVKDNIHVRGEISTCGSRFLENYHAPFDATAVALLESEDAIILGKTNMDEFGMGSSNEHSAYRKAHNPWDLACTPGGSSGGSAAAVAARLCPIALGTDTGGSIRQPAAFCGLFGHKPTYGRVSRYGLVAYGSSLDQIGPLTLNAADSALVMEVIGAPCVHDATALLTPRENLLEFLDAISLKGKKIGIPWQFLEGLRPEIHAHFTKAMEAYKTLGATLVDVDLSILHHSLPTYYIIATAEASTNLARFDGIRYGLRSKRAKTLEEVYDFSKEEGFGPEVKRRILLGTFVLSAGHQDAYYRKAQQVRTLILRQYKEAFKLCDVVATPVTPQEAFVMGSIQDPISMYLQDIYTISANLAGLPASAVPYGLSASQKPLGIQITGPQREDLRVLQFAHALENTLGVQNIPPQFV